MIKSYYSDSEYVTSGPRYTKISRQANTDRRPSNIVLPIRSMTSKAYDDYAPPSPPSPPKPQQQPFDVYRHQQEQQQRLEWEQRERAERQRQDQLQRQFFQQRQEQAVAAARHKPPQITLPTQAQRRKSDSKHICLFFLNHIIINL